MYILEVIPIAKGLPFDTMTYLHNGYVEPGAVANIDIGGRKAKAIVINCRTHHFCVLANRDLFKRD